MQNGTTKNAISKVTVLGAGTMGSRIAGHIANAGIPVVLLDMVPPGTAADAPPDERNRFVLAAMDALKKSRPAAFFSPSSSSLMTIGNFDDDLPLIAGCDWVIEVVAEKLEIKRNLLARVLEHRTPGTILTTNTSGLPIADIAQGLGGDGGEEFRRHWFGTHFFNPPRYMRLLEIIPTPEADPAAVETVAHFCDQRLGKAIVESFDQPNFVANRIGNFCTGSAMHLMQKQGLTVEEIDTLTGAPIGWPNTATFRLGDMVGVDVMTQVAQNFAAQAARIQDERLDLTPAPFLSRMLENKWFGDKTGQGFYKKAGKGPDGREMLQVLNLETFAYGPATRPTFAPVEAARSARSAAGRIPLLLHAELSGDPAGDKATAFYWPYLTELFTYSANRVSATGNEPASNIVAIDRAMKTGYNWELGPFEMMDAAGVRTTIEKMREQHLPIAANVEKLLASGNETWYKDDPSTPSGRQYFDPLTGVYKPVPAAAGITSIATVKKAKGIFSRNDGASLIDFGNGVGIIELHTKMNAVDDDILSFLTETLHPDSAAVRNFTSFVISGDAPNFSAGAHLGRFVAMIENKDWTRLSALGREFQGATQAIKFCLRPVVTAPHGMTLGGGAEIAMHGALRQAHAELYMGLVETSVGIIPGGGGCKELVLAAIEQAGSARADSIGLIDAMQKSFEMVAKATISASAADARTLGYLKPADGVSMNRERLLSDAAGRAAALAASGYTAPVPQTAVPAPGANILANLKMWIYVMGQGGFLSEHDVKVATVLAHAMAGGNVTPGTPVTEQYLLDLEREGGLGLCGEPLTLARMQHTLKVGKPLRN